MADFEAAVRRLSKPPELQPLGTLIGQLVQARLEPLPERQVLTAIKSATGISVAILEKQVSELRRRLNATGDINRQPIRPRWASQLRLDLTGMPEPSFQRVPRPWSDIPSCQQRHLGAV